ncbi:hypothetical protein EVAR_50944_1 [Eumeta japonica]|uniref:Uncharacterized protein n=1 Tax=Eumeta variegata TaxID=151549 RepID=A0A4C1XBV7_EUMVA|nr:hypothetical protein EVAR_50944_1 [Eumeta japonica]
MLDCNMRQHAASIADVFMSYKVVGSAPDGCFSTPYALVDVTVCMFLRMCPIGMKPSPMLIRSFVAHPHAPLLNFEWPFVRTTSGDRSSICSGARRLIRPPCRRSPTWAPIQPSTNSPDAYQTR